MSRKFMAAVVAGAVAFSLIGASPSFAGSRERDKALLGLAAFVLLGAALADVSTEHKRHDHAAHEPVRARPVPPQQRKKTLPRACLRVVNTRGQSIRFLGQRCMQNSYRWTAQLPRNCSVKLWTRQGQRRGYAPQCLRQYGFRLAG